MDLAFANMSGGWIKDPAVRPSGLDHTFWCLASGTHGFHAVGEASYMLIQVLAGTS